jgi:hypothetical protein
MTAILGPIRPALRELSIIRSQAPEEERLFLEFDPTVTFESLARHFGRIHAIPDVLFVIVNRFLSKDETPIAPQIPPAFSFNPAKQDEFWDMQAVIVHTAGEFSVTIRRYPDPNSWIDFRDGHVTEIASTRAVNLSDAVIVMYTKRNRLFDLFREVSPPDHGISAQQPFLVRVLTLEDFERANLRGEIGCGTSGSLRLPVLEDTAIEVLAQSISRELHAESVFLWRVLGTGVIDRPLLPSETCGVLKEAALAYADTFPETVVFAKLFHRELGWPLQLLGAIRGCARDPISSLFAKVSGMLKVPPETPYLVYSENADYSASRVNANATFVQAKIAVGAVLIFQCQPHIAFAPQFPFKAAIPRIQRPVVMQHQMPDLPEDCILMDATCEEDCPDFAATLANADEWFDFQYHAVYVSIAMADEDSPPQFCFRIPWSLSFQNFEALISQTIGLASNLTFFTEIEDKSRTIVNRSLFPTVKDVCPQATSLIVFYVGQ